MEASLQRAVLQCRQDGRKCVLKLLVIEDYARLFCNAPADRSAAAERLIAEQIRHLLPLYYRDEDVLDVRQLRGDEYLFVVAFPDSDTFLDMEYRALQFRDELEQRLRDAVTERIGSPVGFGIGFFMLEQTPSSPEGALAVGYHYARAMATRQVPVSFNRTRKELIDILERQRIDVLAQPIMDLENGAIFGWEMLTRGPTGSPYYKPVNLFELAFSADLLGKLERMVIKRAFREIADRGIREPVFINITSLSLSDLHLYGEVIDDLSLFPSVRPEQIIFEITERHPIKDYRQLSDVVRRYRSHGFRIAIDDAGAGYASLQTISELEPDIIKIDRSLIQDIDRGKVKKSLLKALTHFAKDIDCEVIAEGIERREEADILLQHRVTKAQGYFFAKPAPLAYGGFTRLGFREIQQKISMLTGKAGGQMA